MFRWNAAVATWSLSALMLACSGDPVSRDGDAQVGAQDAGFDGAMGELDGSTTDAATHDAQVTPLPDSGSPFPTNSAGQVLCGDAPCACADGVDQDADGLIDLADPECVSSWDNDETSFATGISGDNRDDACQDCFFDGNSGSGNDGCRLPSSCLSEGNPSSGQGSCNKCEQSDQCKNFCQAYTPNGCDCFGCCTVKLANGTDVNVALGTGCNIDGSSLDGCEMCVPNDSCINTCGRCELCPGKTLADLPADCASGSPDGGPGSPTDGGPGDPGYACDDGAQLCGAGRPACGADYACQFGCCVLLPIILL